MRMRHRNHQNAGFVRVIDQTIRESAEPAATNILAERMPRIGKLPDPFDDAIVSSKNALPSPAT